MMQAVPMGVIGTAIHTVSIILEGLRRCRTRRADASRHVREEGTLPGALTTFVASLPIPGHTTRPGQTAS
jgi:hypothetical protein